MSKAKAKKTNAVKLEAVTESISSVHIVNAVSHSITDDKTMGMIVFDVADEVDDHKIKSTRRFGITIDAKKATWLRFVAMDFENHARRVGAQPKTSWGGWGIGGSKEMPKSTVLVIPYEWIGFSLERPDHLTAMASNVEMCRLARVILRDREPHMTMQEKLESMKLPEQHGQIIKPS